jgi:DNA-binding transcriptional MerR regulator
MAGYTAKEVAELVELPRETIWELTRAGILEPDRTNAFYQYSFQDILILRTAKELIQDGVRKSRLNRALTSLKQRLPTSRPLSSIRISKDGSQIVVREENTVFNAESGQLHLNFDLSANPAVVSQLAKRDDLGHGDEVLTADDWFDLGVDLEAVSPDDAPAAYRRPPPWRFPALPRLNQPLNLSLHTFSSRKKKRPLPTLVREIPKKRCKADEKEDEEFGHG